MKEFDFSKAKRGAVIASPGKTKITIRLDDEVLAWFKERVHRAGGGSYQTAINQVLRDHIARVDVTGELQEKIQAMFEELKSA